MSWSFALALLAVSNGGCRPTAAQAAQEPAHESADDEEKAEKGDKGEKGEKKADLEHDGGAPHAGKPRKFSVPFAAEVDRDDPLAQTRSYVQQLIGDNGAYMRGHETSFFKGFAAGQKPRATVVACSDSRVQSPAFDATPENDDFFVRNIGNQVENGEGSIEYGVEHLKTPVLLVLGHTGCGAVKAAMGDTSKESEAIQKELAPLKVAKSSKPDDPAAWSEAVVANVHDQVAVALDKFGERVSDGQLTIVGAVFDFRNDMHQGFGKVVIVDVNGNREPARIAAFERGVLGLAPSPGDVHVSDAGVREARETRDARDASGPHH